MVVKTPAKSEEKSPAPVTPVEPPVEAVPEVKKVLVALGNGFKRYSHGRSVFTSDSPYAVTPQQAEELLEVECDGRNPFVTVKSKAGRSGDETEGRALPETAAAGVQKIATVVADKKSVEIGTPEEEAELGLPAEDESGSDGTVVEV